MTNDIHEDGAIYRATICDQTMTKNLDGDPQVVFTTRIDGKVRSGVNEDGQVDPIDVFERDVYLTFSKDEQKLRIAVNQLERLGFDDTNVAKLHPEHPEFFSVVNQAVYVRCRVKGDATYWNLAWPRRRAKVVGLEDMQTVAAGLQEEILNLRSKSQGGSVPEKGSDDEAPRDGSLEGGVA